MKKIQLFRHHVYQGSGNNVIDVLQSGWTGLGPKVAEFEQKIAQYLDTPYVIGLNSGTAALELAMACLNANKGDYIITTPLTFVATNHTILRLGLYPVFADIEPDTGNIDVNSVSRLLDNPFIGKRTKALMVVHYGGMPVDMDAIYDLATTHHLDVIEDAAHAFGATYQENKIGCKYSRLVCFSLHSVKPLAIGDGGLLATYDPEINKRVRLLRWFGIDKTTSDRTSGEKYSWDYDVKALGGKYHMNDIQAAIGLGQFEHYEEDRIKRQTLVTQYRERLGNNEKLQLLKTYENRVSSNHLFVILCQNEEIKKSLMQYLMDNGIETGCHYRPNHLYKMYRHFETDDGCPNAINFFKRAISLPLHVDLDSTDIDYICDKIEEFGKEN